MNSAETLTASGGTLFMEGAVDRSGAAATTFEIAKNGIIEFTSSVGSSHAAPTVTFQGSNGLLDYASTAGAEHFGAITGFQGRDQIELTAYGVGDTLSANGDTVTITSANGHKSETLTLASGTAMGQLHLADSGGVDLLTICFMAGP